MTKQSTSSTKPDISYATEHTFLKLILFSQITNLVFSNQFSDESQCHDEHNRYAKSYYYDWCIGRLPGGGSLKITPNGTAYHKRSCQQVTPLQEQINAMKVFKIIPSIRQSLQLHVKPRSRFDLCELEKNSSIVSRYVASCLFQSPPVV